MFSCLVLQGRVALGNQPGGGDATQFGRRERGAPLSRRRLAESGGLGATRHRRRNHRGTACRAIVERAHARSAAGAATSSGSARHQRPGAAAGPDALTTRPGEHGRIVLDHRGRLVTLDSPPVAAPSRQAAPVNFTLPGPRDRLAVLGRTGSGKTHFAAWALSHSNWPKVPWVIIDYKHDPLIAQIPQIEEIKVDAKIPKHPGLYVTHPLPIQTEQVEQLLWRIWQKGHTGLWVDEGHILPDKGSLQALLSQGRSKSVPVIILSQRPVWLNRFVLSESGYFSVFGMNDKRDRQTIASFLPGIDLEEKLPARYSYYYDVAQDRAFLMKPVPGKDDILNRFVDRNPRHAKVRMI
jgi:hypothetical protein